MIQLDTRYSVSSHHGIPLGVIQEKNLNCQVHQDMQKLMIHAEGETRTRNPWITNPVLL